MSNRISISKTVFGDDYVEVYYLLQVGENSKANCVKTFNRNHYFDIIGSDVRKITEYLEKMQ